MILTSSLGVFDGIFPMNSKLSRTLFKIGVKTLLRGCRTSDLGLHCLSMCRKRELGLNGFINIV